MVITKVKDVTLIAFTLQVPPGGLGRTHRPQQVRHVQLRFIRPGHFHRLREAEHVF